MKIFLDTAEVDEIKKAAEIGIIDGVTTNPSLVKKSGRDFKEVVNEIANILPEGAISAEVLSEDAAGMLKEAREYAAWKPNIVIKVPMTEEGIKATKILNAEGIKINITLVFSVSQAILAAKAGAAYVSPFVGRLDDMHMRGMEVVDQIVRTYENYGYETEIIVASVRTLAHVIETAEIGAHIATIPPAILWQMFKSPLTDIGIDKFLKDAGVR